MTQTEKFDFIYRKLPIEELLAQMAEEAAELAQAALKFRRVLDETNPTSCSYEKAVKNLSEEIADVQLCMNVLEWCWAEESDREVIGDIKMKKLDRWVKRLSE